MDAAFIIFLIIGVLMFIAYLVGIYYTSYKDYSKKSKDKPS